MYEESVNVPCPKPASFTLEQFGGNVLTGKESMSHVLGTLSLSIGPNSLHLKILEGPDLYLSLANQWGLHSGKEIGYENAESLV